MDTPQALYAADDSKPRLVAAGCSFAPHCSASHVILVLLSDHGVNIKATSRAAANV
jgi:hypothetical protein